MRAAVSDTCSTGEVERGIPRSCLRSFAEALNGTATRLGATSGSTEFRSTKLGRRLPMCLRYSSRMQLILGGYSELECRIGIVSYSSCPQIATGVFASLAPERQPIVNAKDTKKTQHSEPSLASLEEMPEVDFERATFVGRGLYAHLRQECEHPGHFGVQASNPLHQPHVHRVDAAAKA